MIVRTLRYEVRKESLAQAVDATRAFVDEVGRKEGAVASYKAYQSKDAPTRFLHVASFRVASGVDYHHKTAWRKRFLETVTPLCVAEPTAEEYSDL